MYPASRRMTFWEEVKSVWYESRVEIVLAFIFSALLGVATFCLLIAVQR